MIGMKIPNRLAFSTLHEVGEIIEVHWACLAHATADDPWSGVSDTGPETPAIQSGSELSLEHFADRTDTAQASQLIGRELEIKLPLDLEHQPHMSYQSQFSICDEEVVSPKPSIGCLKYVSKIFLSFATVSMSAPDVGYLSASHVCRSTRSDAMLDRRSRAAG